MPGVYFDDMNVGQMFQHPIRRTITEERAGRVLQAQRAAAQAAEGVGRVEKAIHH